MKNKFLRLGFLLIVAGEMCIIGMAGCENGINGTTKYTVTFDANGGQVSPDTETAEEGKTIASLPTPTKTKGDTVFQGWYTKNGAGNDWGMPFTVLTPITADITVYAKWGSVAPTKYTVTFNPAGGTVNPPSIQVNSGDPSGYLPIPTKNDNTFGGWWTSQNGGGAQFIETTIVGAHITIYAKWQAPNGPKEISITGLSAYAGNRIQVKLTNKGTAPVTNPDILFGSVDDQGGILIPGGGNVVVPLYVANEGLFDQPWTGSGPYYIMVTFFVDNDNRSHFLSKQKIQFTSTTTEIHFTASDFTEPWT